MSEIYQNEREKYWLSATSFVNLLPINNANIPINAIASQCIDSATKNYSINHEIIKSWD